MAHQAADTQRIVITGIGLTAPNGNSLAEYREALLTGQSGPVGGSGGADRLAAGRRQESRLNPW